MFILYAKKYIKLFRDISRSRAIRQYISMRTGKDRCTFIRFLVTFYNRRSVVICQAYRMYAAPYANNSRTDRYKKQLATFASNHIGPAVLYSEGRIKAGFRIVIRRDRVHVISRKDRERQSQERSRKEARGQERDEKRCVRQEALNVAGAKPRSDRVAALGRPCLDVTSLVPAIPLSDRICGRLVSPRSSMRKGKLIRMRFLPRTSSSAAVCVILARLSGVFLTGTAPLLSRTYFFLFLIRRFLFYTTAGDTRIWRV